MADSRKAQEIAKRALAILGARNIPDKEDLIEVLATTPFLMMSTIDFDIVETSRKIASHLKRGELEEASSNLKKLKELVSASDFE